MVGNFDIGATITTIPSVLKTKVNNASAKTYKTASGELLPNKGGAVRNGYDNYGRGKSIQGRFVNV